MKFNEAVKRWRKVAKHNRKSVRELLEQEADGCADGAENWCANKHMHRDHKEAEEAYKAAANILKAAEKE